MTEDCKNCALNHNYGLALRHVHCKHNHAQATTELATTSALNKSPPRLISKGARYKLTYDRRYNLSPVLKLRGRSLCPMHGFNYSR